jgi:hypothetical protein
MHRVVRCASRFGRLMTRETWLYLSFSVAILVSPWCQRVPKSNAGPP